MVNQLVDMQWKFGGKMRGCNRRNWPRESKGNDINSNSHTIIPYISHVVTAGSSEARRVGSTFLQMKLSLDRGSKTEDVCLGMSGAQIIYGREEESIERKNR